MASLLTGGSPSRIERLERATGRFVVVFPAEESVSPDHAAIVPD
jgi:hypothetical protein